MKKLRRLQRRSSKEIKNDPQKTIRIAGKGHNETLENINPVEGTRTAVDAVDGHVPGNGGTCVPGSRSNTSSEQYQCDRIKITLRLSSCHLHIDLIWVFVLRNRNF
jgi:hypothetical protein